MTAILYVLSAFANMVLSAVLFAMFLRVLLPLFMDEESKIMNFLYFVTEPFIMPVRALMVKFNILQDTPIDFSYFITQVIICFILMFIGV